MSRWAQILLFCGMFIVNSIDNRLIGLNNSNYWLKTSEFLSWMVMWGLFMWALEKKPAAPERGDSK